tara:strand:+ start:80 stop:439 length:360 start_codon:yes stop_codon:yes gene_type:complete
LTAVEVNIKMKNGTKFGFLVLACMLIITAACTKSPSDRIYNTWILSDVNMPDADSVDLAKLDAQGITYTLYKDGKYTSIGAIMGEGTFEINNGETSLSISEEGSTAVYDVQVTAEHVKT